MKKFVGCAPGGRKRRLRVAACIVALAAVCGCSLVNRLLVKPPEEEVTVTSSSVRVIGYEETVTVKADADEFWGFFSDPRRLVPGGIEMGGSGDDSGGELTLGSSFPFNLSRMGIEVKGRMIVVRSTDHELWTVWDNPQLMQIQRWKTTPERDGIKLTLRVETEMPDDPAWEALEPMVEYVNQEVFREVDLMLAQIQAHFDPSLSPEELVSRGLRGEGYESFFQEIEARVWMDVSEDYLMKWMEDPANLAEIMPEYEVDWEGALEAARDLPPGGATWMPGAYRNGLIRSEVNFFSVKPVPGSGDVLRTYSESYNNLSLISMSSEPISAGTMTAIRYLGEVPGSFSPEQMDLITFAAGLPRMVQDKAVLFKQKVEASR